MIDKFPCSVTYFRSRRNGPEVLLEDAVARAIPEIFTTAADFRWTAASAQIGAGLPDLLIVNCHSALLTLANVDLPETEILAYLKIVGGASAKAIAASTKRSLGRTVRSLDQLEQIRAITKTPGRNQFRLTRHWRSILPEIIAIEVKVVDWRKAICQAARNRIFTHLSYVALPKETALRIRNNNLLAHFGIGLLAVDNNNKLSLIRKSMRAQPRVWTYYYQLASLAARHLKTRA